MQIPNANAMDIQINENGQDLLQAEAQGESVEHSDLLELAPEPSPLPEASSSREDSPTQWVETECDDKKLQIFNLVYTYRDTVEVG